MDTPLTAICMGECMVELRQDGPDLYRRSFAGDVLNTAVYLKRSAPQIAVKFLSVTGDDPLSDQMRQFWDGQGIDASLCFSSPGSPPGLYMIELDRFGERSFRYWRESSPARQWLARLMAEGGADRLAGASLVYLSGISLAILSAEDRARAMDLLDALRGRVGMIAFDPNYRPRLWPSALVAREAMGEAIRRADIILPSQEDIAALDLPLDRGEIVQSLGPEGCRIQTEDGVIDLPAPYRTDNPMDTSGAGDSFNGGYLAARLLGRPVVDAARAGLAVACRVVNAPGAIVPAQVSHPAFACAAKDAMPHHLHPAPDSVLEASEIEAAKRDKHNSQG